MAGYSLTWVTDHLAVGHAPMSHAHLDHLRSEGVDAIMNLCGEFCDLHEIEAESGFEVYYLPLADEEAPEMAELEKALAWLDEAIYLGKRVLIHCRHGIGRTGTILNAYLLRRGLGHRLAGQRLKKLRSKPANFDQWWTIRRYGRSSKRLTVREPSLEYRNIVDLAPFLEDYNALSAKADEYVEQKVPDPARCGREHDRCCSTPVSLSMIEAVYLAHRINAHMKSDARLAAIERAVETARSERRTTGEIISDKPFCLMRSGAFCPLSENARCVLFENRPMQCRLFELPEDRNSDLWDELIGPALSDLSRQVYLAFTGELPRTEPPRFALPDVVSGRYVQTFFHHLRDLNAF